MTLPDGSIYEEHAQKRVYSLDAPIIKAYKVVDGRAIKSMQELADKEYKRGRRSVAIEWLANRYKVSRSFVITHALSMKQRVLGEAMMREQISGMSIKAARGFLYRHKLKLHRLNNS